MQINSNSKLTVQIGRKRYPVLEKKAEDAREYDLNKNGNLTAEEIKGDSESTHGINDRVTEYMHSLAGRPSPHLDYYPTQAEIRETMSELVQAYPDKAQMVTIGESVEGRTIEALRISNNVASPDTDDKPSVIVTGNLHAREWVTNRTVTSAARKVLEGEAEEALENLELWFLPNGNPDGYIHSREVDNMWRKNNARNESGEIVGVDLNRNFPFEYRHEGDSPDSTDDDEGGSDDPNRITFRGPGALSERETQNVVNLINSEENAIGLIDVHSYGKMLIVPEGKHKVTKAEYRELHREVNKAIKGANYVIKEGNALYKTTGTLRKYADSVGLAAVTMEVGTSFQPNPEVAEKSIDRSSDGVVEFIRQMEKRV